MICNVLKPVDGELLSSWLLRNIKANDYLNSKNNRAKVARHFIGENKTFPDLMWVNVSNILKENKLCNIIDFLSDQNAVINKMTIIPFVNSFIKESIVANNINDYKEYYKKNGIKVLDNNGEYAKIVYVCPECMKENQEPLLYREHQIIGNMVCHKGFKDSLDVIYTKLLHKMYVSNKTIIDG